MKRKGARRGRPGRPRAGSLFCSLGLLCKRVARSDDHICVLVLHAVLGVDALTEVTGDEYRSPFLEDLLGDRDVLGSVLGEHHGIHEEGWHTLGEVVCDGEAGDLAVLAVEVACV